LQTLQVVPSARFLPVECHDVRCLCKALDVLSESYQLQAGKLMRWIAADVVQPRLSSAAKQGWRLCWQVLQLDRALTQALFALSTGSALSDQSFDGEHAVHSQAGTKLACAKPSNLLTLHALLHSPDAQCCVAHRVAQQLLS
jgi:hypothetical protein